MLEVAATQQVTQTLASLRETDPEAFGFVRDRIRLIRTDPGDPRARGLVRKMPGGPLVRSIVIAGPTSVWRLAWSLGESDTVQLLVLERG